MASVASLAHVAHHQLYADLVRSAPGLGAGMITLVVGKWTSRHLALPIAHGRPCHGVGSAGLLAAAMIAVIARLRHVSTPEGRRAVVPLIEGAPARADRSAHWAGPQTAIMGSALPPDAAADAIQDTGADQ